MVQLDFRPGRGSRPGNRRADLSSLAVLSDGFFTDPDGSTRTWHTDACVPDDSGAAKGVHQAWANLQPLSCLFDCQNAPHLFMPRSFAS
jgi:hypothetical protein